MSLIKISKSHYMETTLLELIFGWIFFSQILGNVRKQAQLRHLILILYIPTFLAWAHWYHTFNKANYSELVDLLMTPSWTSKTVPSLLGDAFIYWCPRSILQNPILAAYVKTHENVSLVPRGFYPLKRFLLPSLCQKNKNLWEQDWWICLFSSKNFGQKCFCSLDPVPSK